MNTLNHTRFAYNQTLHVLRYRDYVRANRRIFGTRSDAIIERCDARLLAFKGISPEGAKAANLSFFNNRVLVGVRHVRFVQ